MSLFRHTAQRFWALFVLSVMLGSAVVPLAGDLHADVDAICAEDGWELFHHDAPQFEGIRPPVGGGHCAICHLQRALTGAADDAKCFVDTPDVVTRHVVVVECATRPRAIRDVPSRAPPAFL